MAEVRVEKGVSMGFTTLQEAQKLRARLPVVVDGWLYLEDGNVVRPDDVVRLLNRGEHEEFKTTLFFKHGGYLPVRHSVKEVATALGLRADLLTAE